MRVYIKIIVACVLIVGALVWAVTSIRTHSYSGTDLNVSIGQGLVTVSNPDQASVPVQLVSPGTRGFAVTSSIAGVTGSSVKQGTGGSTSQLFEFAPPSGTSTFTVARGNNVSFVTPATGKLDVTVEPLLERDARTTVIAAAVAVLLGLYYISRTTGHRWIGMVRSRIMPAQAAPVAVVTAPAVVREPTAEFRSFGDNRADISKP